MKKQKFKFPVEGIPKNALLSLMQMMKEHDADWKKGKIWSLVYYAGEEIAAVVEAAYDMYFFENGLNPTAFSSLRKLETETVAMAADLLNGDADVVGNITSGGTESILMAVKCARDKALSEHPEINMPEMILPVTAHPAFEKAAHYLSVKAVHIPVGDDFRADIKELERAINKNTILIVGSAPSYPHGVMDPIEEIAKIASARNILCHVDACIGGFMLPFVKKLGYTVPEFDFKVQGVTSMSTDLHKYGFSAKGASLILYKNSELRKFQYFVYTDWPGGIYASPSMTGTRPGGAIAASWAVIKYLGADGYLSITEGIMKTTKKLIRGINNIPGLKVIGNPDMSVLAFTSDRYDILNIGDEMTLKGWHIDRQQFPDCLHLIVTPVHKEVADEFLRDLFSAVARVRKLNWGKISSHLAVSMVKGASKILPEKLFGKLAAYSSNFINLKDYGSTRTAAIYGITAALPNRGDVREMVLKLLDNLTKPH